MLNTPIATSFMGYRNSTGNPYQQKFSGNQNDSEPTTVKSSLSFNDDQDRNVITQQPQRPNTVTRLPHNKKISPDTQKIPLNYIIYENPLIAGNNEAFYPISNYANKDSELIARLFPNANFKKLILYKKPTDNPSETVASLSKKRLSQSKYCPSSNFFSCFPKKDKP
ncbi:MAG: hypothetical protein AAGI66_00960 [Cyanobacteria bacterium P01_H01_bin.74]